MSIVNDYFKQYKFYGYVPQGPVPATDFSTGPRQRMPS